MQILNDETLQNAIEAASTEGALPSIVQMHSPHEVTFPPTAATEEHADANPAETTDDKQAPAIFRNVLTEFVSILTLSVAPGLNAMSVGSVNIALPSIGRDLSIDNSNLTWVVAAYSVANGCLLLTSGRLADLFGRRKVFFFGAYAYLVTTIICGFAKNGIMLFIFRALQGLSSAISVPGAIGIVGATYHRYNKRKAFAFAIVGGMATTGFLAGIILGGICAQFLTWRWLFFITAIIAEVMILSTHFVVPVKAGEDDKKPNIPKKYKEIDWWGQFLSISGLVLLAFSLTYSSETRDGWRTWYIILLLMLSVALLGLFIWVEHIRGEKAMMSLAIWKNPQFSLVMAILFFGWFDFEIVTLYMTFLFQNVRGVSPLLCTLYFLPDAGFGVITALAMAVIIPNVHAKILCLAGILFLLSAPILMATSPAQQSYWPRAFPAVSLSSIGGMILFNVSNVFVSSSVKRELQGLGQGIFNTVVQIGTAISLALAATIAHAGGVAEGASTEDLLRGYRNCFWFSAGLLVIPFVLSFFLRKGSASGTPEQAVTKRKEKEKREVENQVKGGEDTKSGNEGKGEQKARDITELDGDEITRVEVIPPDNTPHVKLHE